MPYFGAHNRYAMDFAFYAHIRFSMDLCVLRTAAPIKLSSKPLNTPRRLDLRDIRVLCKPGGTVDDSELVDGLVFDQKAAKTAGGPTKVWAAARGMGGGGLLSARGRRRAHQGALAACCGGAVRG